MTGYYGEMDKVGEGFGTLEHIYDQYASSLFRYARAMLNAPEDAEDAVQEVFVRLARDIRKLDRVKDLRSYLLKAVRNAVYEQLRGRRNRERLVENAAQGLGDRVHCKDLPEIEAVLEAFSKLPHDQREVLALKVFQGLTFREIAEVVGKSQNTVQSRYRYAVERIRAEVGEI